MKNKINRKVLGVILLLGFVFLFAAPVFAADGIVPCGNDGNACTLCHLIAGIKILFDYGIKIITIVVLACATFAGVMYVVSSGNESMMESAKKFLSASLIGFAVVLGAWVMVNTTITVLMPTKKAADAGGVLGIGKSWVDFGSIDCSASRADNSGALAMNTVADNSNLSVGAVGSDMTLEPFAVTGGSGTYVWSAANLPEGLSIDSSTGVISGTANKEGVYVITVTATDAKAITLNDSAGRFLGTSVALAQITNEAPSVSKELTLVINSANIDNLLIKTNSLKEGKVGVPYSASIEASAVNGVYSWTTTALPDGLALGGCGIPKNSSACSNNIQIYGTPVNPGSYKLIVVLTVDSTVISKTFDLVVVGDPANTLSITTAYLADGIANTAYNSSLSAIGGSGTYEWSIAGLPGGLSQTNNVISGTPLTAGTYTVKVTAVSGEKSVSKNFELVISETAVPGSLAMTITSLPSAVANVPYSVPLSAIGGNGTYLWFEMTMLPAGLSLNGDVRCSTESGPCKIVGTPTAAGTYKASLSVTSGGQRVNKQFNLTVASTATESTPGPSGTLSITTTSLPDGKVGVAYGQNIEATVVSGNYSWFISRGNFPPGLKFAGCPTPICSNKGKITGTPTKAGKYVFTVTVDVGGSNGQSVDKDFSLNIGTCDCMTAGEENPTTTSCAGNRQGDYTKVKVCDGCYWVEDWSKVIDNCSTTECLDGYVPLYTAAGMVCRLP